MGIKKNVPNVIHNVKPTPPPILKMEVSVIGPSQSGQLNRRVTPLYLPRFPSNKGLARLQHSRQVRASCWQSRNRSTRTVHSGSMGSAVKTLDTNHGDRPARSTRSPLHNLVLNLVRTVFGTPAVWQPWRVCFLMLFLTTDTLCANVNGRPASLTIKSFSPRTDTRVSGLNRRTKAIGDIRT